MAKKLHSIGTDGQVLFVDQTGRGQVGTQDDCLAYGYTFKNSKCYNYSKFKAQIPEGVQKGSVFNKLTGGANNVRGSLNEVHGSNNNAIGDTNYIKANNSFIFGSGVYTMNDGEVALGYSGTQNRSRYCVVHYNGTTTNENATEIYIGGIDDNRYRIDEAYEYAIAFDYTACALNASSNEVWTEYGHATYKFVGGSLSEVGHQTGHTIRDSALDYDIDFTATNSTPDFIKVDVTGESGHTAYWTVVLNLTEVRFG